MNIYNCHQHEYLEAHGDKDERATVCLSALGIIFILTSYGDVFVVKQDVTLLMNVGQDEPALKDACKFVSRLGVLTTPRSRLRLTKSWLCYVELKLKFNRATPECMQDPLFMSWMEQLNTALLRNPRCQAGQPRADLPAQVGNAGGGDDKSDTKSEN